MCVHSVKLLWVLPRSFTSNSHWRERARHLSEFFQEKWWRTGGKGRGGGWAEASLWVAPLLNHHLPLAPLSSLIPGRCQLGGAGCLKAHLGKRIVPRASSTGTPSSGSFQGAPQGTRPLPAPASPSTFPCCTSVLSFMDFWKLVCFGGSCFWKTSLGGK